MMFAQQHHFSDTELEAVRNRCAEILTTRSSSYLALLRSLKGTSPDLVVAALATLAPSSPVQSILTQAGRPLSSAQIQGLHLPLPHPQDAEWRFDSQTVDALLTDAISVTNDGDKILLYGTPGAAIGARSMMSDRVYSVVSPPNIVTESVRAFACSDARFQFGRVGRHSCRAVLMDPPWYLPAYAQMLAGAAALCHVHCYLFLSVPSEGTRPSAATDNEEVVKIAANLGFELVERRLGALRYISPLFEISAFAARGVYAPAGWRCSDLYIFKRTRLTKHTAVSGVRGRSFELTIGGCRIRLNVDQPVSTPLSDDLTPIIAGEIYPSVSTRHPDRAQANLWTSTNRAYSVDPAKGLLALAIAANTNGVMLPERLDQQVKRAQSKGLVDTIQPLIQKLEDVVATEIRESRRLTQGVDAWLNSTNDARFLNG